MVRSAHGSQNPPPAPTEADLGEDYEDLLQQSLEIFSLEEETGAAKAATFGQEGKMGDGKATEMDEVAAGQLGVEGAVPMLEPFYIYEDNSKLQSTEELRNKITELEEDRHNLKLKLIHRIVESCAYKLECQEKDDIIKQKDEIILAYKLECQQKDEIIKQKDEIIIQLKDEKTDPAARKCSEEKQVKMPVKFNLRQKDNVIFNTSGELRCKCSVNSECKVACPCKESKKFCFPGECRCSDVHTKSGQAKRYKWCGNRWPEPDIDVAGARSKREKEELPHVELKEREGRVAACGPLGITR